MRVRGPGSGCRVPGIRPEGVEASRAARVVGTVVSARRRQLCPDLISPATRGKPGHGSVVPRECIPYGWLTPCLSRFCELFGTGLPRAIVLAHRLRPSCID